MSTNTTILSGSFTSNGGTNFVPLRSGVAWLNVYNSSLMASPSNGNALQGYWQLGMPDTYGVLYLYASSSTSTNPFYGADAGFSLVDTSQNAPGTINATITAVSTATIPVATNSGTNNLVAGNIVRLYNVAGAHQLDSIDFTVGYNTLNSTHFSLDYMSTLGGAGTTGSWAVIPFDPIYYPRRRYITKITQASQAVVTLSVTHGYQVGQIVRFTVPSQYGMYQMNGLQGTIVAINTTTTTGNTITVNINSSAFNAFAFPATGAVPFSPAEVVPVGMDTAIAESLNVNILSDATVNTAQVGMNLSGGAAGAGGANGNLIFWTAGTSFNQP
jgi:hypothetical protein